MDARKGRFPVPNSATRPPGSVLSADCCFEDDGPEQRLLVFVQTSQGTYLCPVPLYADRFQQAEAQHAPLTTQFGGSPSPPGATRVLGGTLTIWNGSLCCVIPGKGVWHCRHAEGSTSWEPLEPWQCPDLSGLCALGDQLFGSSPDGLKLVRVVGGGRKLRTRMGPSGEAWHLLAPA